MKMAVHVFSFLLNVQSVGKVESSLRAIQLWYGYVHLIDFGHVFPKQYVRVVCLRNHIV